jgi:hypothetical protein
LAATQFVTDAMNIVTLLGGKLIRLQSRIQQRQGLD